MATWTRRSDCRKICWPAETASESWKYGCWTLRDGVEQISQILSGYGELDAVHRARHGAEGKLRLGNTWLDGQNQAAYAGQLATWRHAMRDGGDLLIYGCDVAGGSQGQTFVEALSAAARMDVAASVDGTGHASLGGDWELEYRAGAVETPALFGEHSQANWQQLLAVTPISPPGPYQAGADVQRNADVAVFADGSFIGVADSSNDGSSEGVFGRLFNSSGTPIGSVLPINQTTLDQQIDPAVALGGSGNFVVVWTSRQSGDWDIYARVYNSAGTPQTGEMLVNASYTANDQQNADVAVDAAGNFVVVWEGEGPGDAAGLFGQRFLSDGTPNGGLFQVNSSTPGSQDNAAVAMDIDGDFVVTWTDRGSTPAIRGQRFNAAGTGQGEFAVRAAGVDTADLSSVAMDDAGNFVVAWSEQNVDGSQSGVRLRRFNAAGGALSGDVLVNTTTALNQFDPSVSMDSDGHFVITWTSEGQDGDAAGVVLRAYNPDGTAASGEMLVNTYGTSDQHVSQVSLNDFGRFVVVWEGQAPAIPRRSTAGCMPGPRRAAPTRRRSWTRPRVRC